MQTSIQNIPATYFDAVLYQVATKPQIKYMFVSDLNDDMIYPFLLIDEKNNINFKLVLDSERVTMWPNDGTLVTTNFVTIDAYHPQNKNDIHLIAGMCLPVTFSSSNLNDITYNAVDHDLLISYIRDGYIISINIRTNFLN